MWQSIRRHNDDRLRHPFDSLPCAMQHIAHEPLLGLRTSGRCLRGGGLPALAASVARSAVGPAAGLGPLPHLPSIEPTSTAPPTSGHGWCAVCDGRSTVRFTVATVSPRVPFPCSPIAPTTACVPATPCRTATRVVSTVPWTSSTISPTSSTLFSTEPRARRWRSPGRVLPRGSASRSWPHGSARYRAGCPLCAEPWPILLHGLHGLRHHGDGL